MPGEFPDSKGKFYFTPASAQKSLKGTSTSYQVAKVTFVSLTPCLPAAMTVRASKLEIDLNFFQISVLKPTCYNFIT